MKNYKKILAGVLATSMVLGNSAVVFADEGGQAKGSGKVEGQVKNEVFSVVLPTESDYAGAFDYIIDPLQLIAMMLVTMVISMTKLNLILIKMLQCFFTMDMILVHLLK